MKDFVILIDRREQEPYTFLREDQTQIPTEFVFLDAGDYSIKGMAEEIAIERKSIDDLAQTLSRARDRFFKEIKKLQKYKFACIIVEGTIEDILQHRYNSPRASCNSIMGTVVSLIVDYGIPVFFCGDRPHAVYLTQKILTMIWEHQKS